MEEKKATKISLSLFFLILALIVIVIMCIFIFKINNEKNLEMLHSIELQYQLNTLNSTINNLQDKINAISEKINSDNITENNNSTTNTTSLSATDDQLKTALVDYLELESSANCGTTLETLNKKGKINYDSSKDSINTNTGEIITSVKFSDYKKAMLNYVTDEEFERNWTSKIDLKENSNGYVTKGQSGGGYRYYTISSITKISDFTYSAKATSIVEDDNSTKQNHNFTFTIKLLNGNCVIDSFQE